MTAFQLLEVIQHTLNEAEPATASERWRRKTLLGAALSQAVAMVDTLEDEAVECDDQIDRLGRLLQMEKAVSARVAQLQAQVAQQHELMEQVRFVLRGQTVWQWLHGEFGMGKDWLRRLCVEGPCAVGEPIGYGNQKGALFNEPAVTIQSGPLAGMSVDFNEQARKGEMGSQAADGGGGQGPASWKAVSEDTWR